MTDETKNSDQQTNQPEAAPAVKSGSLIKYIIFGVVGLIALVGIMVVTLLVVGVNKSAPTEQAQTVDQTPVKSTHDSTVAQLPAGQQAGSSEDSLLKALESDPSVLDNIMQNLEFLDYKPNEGELADANGSDMSEQDSLKKVSWIESETSRLNEWEKKLKSREKELAKLDKEVSQKMLKIEQAESTRITSLAKLYDGMEPGAVANLMANLDDETVIAILPRMKQKNASDVLGLISAKRAARLSKQMITIAAN